MRKLFLTICLTIVALVMNANPVDFQTARKVAENFAIAQRVPVTEVISLVSEQMFTQLYVFGFRGQKGFVIVSADDRSIPVLGYSFTTEFRSDDMPEHITAWLRDYENQIDWLIAKRIEPSTETQRRWSELQGDVAGRISAALIDTIVPPLITTIWNQRPYYNDLCPFIGSTQAPTGCSATSMAQVMKYWNHPTTGHGSYSYSCNGQTLSADFGNTTYDWANMPDSLGASSTAAQVNAVATLMYHVGVSMNMYYGAKSSASWHNYSKASNSPCSESALKNYFKYSNTLHGILYCCMTDAQWKNTLKNELDNSRPVIYEGRDYDGGHSFICDGYDSQDYFHFNWGWGGYCDAFYAIGALNPAPGGTGASTSSTYNIENSAIIGIEPILGAIPQQTVVTTAVNDTLYGYVTGAGTYNQYDNITLTANARQGYIFDRWDDGDCANPRYIPATSATFNRTAYFKPLSKDTLGYCVDTYFGYEGVYYDTARWGIRYPSSALKSRRVVDAVQFYPQEVGQYSVVLYQGDSTNMVPVYTEDFNVSATGDWLDLILANPYPIDTTRSLWITLKCVGLTYPMTMAIYFSGNRDGLMFCEDSVWQPLYGTAYHYTWMIRAITSDSASISDRYNVTLVSTPDSCGTVTANPPYSRIYAGTEFTLTAQAARNCKFIMWSDSCLDYQRTLTPTSDTTLTAIFEPLRPDTTTYCISDKATNAFGYKTAGPYYWAVCVRAGLYSQYDSIKSIMIYDYNPSNIDLTIYAGNSTSGTPLHTQSFAMTGGKQWLEVPLTNPVPCPVNENLWVTFGEPVGSLCATASIYSANADGGYRSQDGVNWFQTQKNGIYRSWMVKIVTTKGSPETGVQYVAANDVSLVPNPIHTGETAYIYGEWSEADLDGMVVEVLTADGRCITRTTPQAYPIAIRGINAPGIYLVRITTGTGELHLRKLTVN